MDHKAEAVMISSKALRYIPLLLTLTFLSLIACQREAKAPPGAVKMDGVAI